MPIDPRQAIMQMMMQAGAGGPPMPQGVPQGSPPMSAGPPQDMQLPPQIEALARQGIGPQQFAQMQRGGGSGTDAPGSQGDVDEEEDDNTTPTSADKEDPRFGPRNDPARDQTEGELEGVRQAMGGGDLKGLTDELRVAVDEGDQQQIDRLLKECEDMGHSYEDLPPDLRDQIDQMNDSGTDSPGSRGDTREE